MVRIGVYCEHCMRFVEFGPEAGPCGEIRWIAKCDWCREREGKAQAELERLEQMWAARVCAADDCSVVFVPATSTQRFHDDRCRKRAHRRLKARLRS